MTFTCSEALTAFGASTSSKSSKSLCFATKECAAKEGDCLLGTCAKIFPPSRGWLVLPRPKSFFMKILRPIASCVRVQIVASFFILAKIKVRGTEHGLLYIFINLNHHQQSSYITYLSLVFFHELVSGLILSMTTSMTIQYHFQFQTLSLLLMSPKGRPRLCHPQQGCSPLPS